MDRKKLFEFWIQSASATFGTVVGIILTFGTTLCLQRCEQKQMERKESLWVIYDIDGFCKGLDSSIKKMEAADSINKVVWENRNNLDQISHDTLNLFVSNLMASFFKGSDNTVESIFSTNIDTWKNMSSYDFVRNAGTCLSLKRKIQEMCDEISEEERQICITIMSILEYSDNPVQTPYDFFERILKLKNVRSFISQQTIYKSFLKAQLMMLKDLNSKNKKIMQVTDEDLLKTFSKEPRKEYHIKNIYNN